MSRVKRKSIKMKLPHYKCLRCQHEWIPRKEDYPRMCPECKSVRWDKPKKDNSQLPSAKAGGLKGAKANRERID